MVLPHMVTVQCSIPYIHGVTTFGHSSVQYIVYIHGFTTYGHISVQYILYIHGVITYGHSSVQYIPYICVTIYANSSLHNNMVFTYQ